MQALVEGFAASYGGSPQIVARAPGRLEILGNHTDYNEGVVLSCAVDRNTWFAARPVAGRRCQLHDLRDASQAEFSLDELATPRRGEWANYVKGVIVELNRRGAQVPAFEAALVSTIPMSAGMSSSAALEIATAYALGRLAGVDFPWVEWAKIGQGCENNYVGARTGLLDQFSSIKGSAGQLVFSDFRDLTVRNVPLPAGTAMVVANCMVKHNLTNEYNERRESCEEAVAGLANFLPGITALRDVSLAQLDRHQAELPVIAARRARHVIGENERVLAGIAALERGDVAGFGRLMFASHESSRVNFENSCQELDQLVEIGKSLPGALGARLSGGGFGGITVHLVDKSQADRYATRLRTAYAGLTGQAPEVMICHAGAGAEIVSL